MSNKSAGAARNRITAGLVLLGFAASGVVVQPAPVAASSLVTTTYQYTGATETFMVPPGVSSITVTLKGGQGGRGGYDSQGAPIPGGYQGVVSGVIAVTPDDVITVAVGGGGGTGNSSQGSAPGGYGGQNPRAEYSGAQGGTAGPEGSSGGGGGSGAASVLQIGATGTEIEIVAGGAGGNGGNGQFYPIVGRRAEESHVARSDITSSPTTGRPGVDTWTMCSVNFRCDGGASGAGGGGAVGGEHGAVQYGGDYATEYFGFGGYPGANSTAGLTGLTGSYDYYDGNNGDGTITITYDDGAPSAPLNLAGTGGTNAVTLMWNAPAASGKSAITDYLVELSPTSGGPFEAFDDGISATTGAEVTGLTNGGTYFFRVAAVNDEGTGAAAMTTIAIVPSDVPAPPTVIGLVPFGAGIHVDFAPAGSDAPITAYEYRLDDAGNWTIGAVTADRMTISGLTNGQAYAVAIRARNIIGASDASTPQLSATPLDVAHAPTALLADATDASVGLSWEAPLVNNGAPVTDYLVQMATTADGPYETFADGPTASTSATITPLVNGTTYYFRVAAINDVGEGAWSTSTVATPHRVPDAPSITLTPGDGALTVAITPGFDGGSVVTGYAYRLGAGGTWKATGSTTTGFVIAGLTNATSYDVFVHAINAAGPSLASTVVSGVPRTVPAAPAIATVALDTGAVSVSFIVGSDGGSALTNVEYSTDGGTTWITRSPASIFSPVTIGGLVGGQTYPVRLRVVNDAGVSAASNISSVTAKCTPDAPLISVTAADRALVVTFAAPANGGTPITNYEYSLNDGATWTSRSPAATSSPIVIGGLVNGTSYSVRLQAVNAVGSGAPSSTVVGVPLTVPGAPMLDSTTIAGGDGNLDVRFTAPVVDGGSAIVGYQYSTDAGTTWRDRQTGSTESPLRITTTSSDAAAALIGGQPYPVEIRALNVVGAGAASAVATGITRTVPGKPVILAVDTRDASASIRFTPPANGGSAIIEYQYRLDQDTWYSTGSLADEFVLSGLYNSVTYSLEIRAVNGVGDSLASDPQWVEVFTAPAAPALGAIVAGDEALAVGFTATGDGGSPITGYEYSTDGGATWRSRVSGTTGTPLLITNESGAGASTLTNATIYAVQLRAVNAAGAGAASETVLAAPRGTPSAPTAMNVGAGDGALVVTFTSGDDRGSPITAIEYRLDDTGEWIDPGSLASPLTVGGLNNGELYSIAVRALNAVGPGTASLSLSGTPRTVPGAPTGVLADSGSRQVTVSWTAPATDGGAPIAGYTVSLHLQATGGTAIATCTTQGLLTCTASELTNGTTVYADVTAANDAGAGAPSSPRLALTPLAVPQVAIESITPGANDLSIAVDIIDDGGAPITAFQYQLDDGNWLPAHSATSPFTIPGLTTGLEYSVRIRAITAAGIGDASPAVTAVPHTAPSAPTALSATGAAASAVLSWAAPANSGGQPVTDYIVQYSADNGEFFTTFTDETSSATTATVTGLTNAIAYVVRVAAVNTAGPGSWSALASATPLDTPSAPTSLTVTPGSSFLQVAFTAPASDGGSVVTGYEYRLNDGLWRTASATSSPLMISGLTNGQLYDVQIRALNAVGGGAESAAVLDAKPFGLPGAVIGLHASPAPSSVTLTWDAVDDNGSPITAYNVIRWSSATEGWIDESITTTATTHTFTGLWTGTYYYTIEATNAAGTGPRSAPRTTTVVVDMLPEAPWELRTSVDDAAMTMTWVSGDAGTSPITDYLVQYSTDEITWTPIPSGPGETAAFELPSASTPYAVRVAAISELGTGAFTMVRPPIAETGAVSDVSSRGAAIVGAVNSTEDYVGIEFEVATAADELGTSAATMVAATSAYEWVTANTAVSATLTDLEPGTSYFVRIVVTSYYSYYSYGTVSRGAIRTFTTDIEAVSTPITVEGLVDTALDGGPLVLPAVTPGNLPLTYTADPASVCTVAGTAVSLHGVGTCTVTADQAGDAGHLPATATGTFSVTAVVPPTPPTPPIPELSLQVEAGQVGGDSAIVVDGDGFKPYSTVRIELHSTPVLLSIVTSDASGSFNATVRLPHVVTPGTHHIVAVGFAADDGAVQIAEELFVDWSGSLSEKQTGGGYTPLTATRILDTRESGAPMTAGAEYRLAVPASSVPSDVTALVLNLAVTESTNGGYITLYPCESARPFSAAINFTVGETKANLVDAMFRTDSVLCLWSNVDTHAVVDLQGFHSTSGSGRLVPRTAVRLVDTRPADALDAGQVLKIPVIGDGMARAGTTTVALNVAVDDPQQAGFLTVYPCGTNRPWAANLNFAAGRTISNEVLVEPGADGMVCVYTMAPTHLIVDLNATYDATAAGSFTPLVSGRLADTRSTTKVLGGEIVELHIVTATGAPAGTTGLSLNVAVTEPEGPGYLTVYPCNATMPLAANLNFAAGQTTSNHVTATVSDDGRICVFASRTTHVVVDVEGIYRQG